MLNFYCSNPDLESEFSMDCVGMDFFFYRCLSFHQIWVGFSKGDEEVGHAKQARWPHFPAPDCNGTSSPQEKAAAVSPEDNTTYFFFWGVCKISPRESPGRVWPWWVGDKCWIWNGTLWLAPCRGWTCCRLVRPHLTPRWVRRCWCAHGCSWKTGSQSRLQMQVVTLSAEEAARFERAGKMCIEIEICLTALAIFKTTQKEIAFILLRSQSLFITSSLH